MKRIVFSGILALLIILVFSVPSMAQETTNVTANVTATTNVTTTTAATTNATTTAAAVTSFLQAANNTTAPPVPGFEVILAVVGLLCIALILIRKRG